MLLQFSRIATFDYRRATFRLSTLRLSTILRIGGAFYPLPPGKSHRNLHRIRSVLYHFTVLKQGGA
nr:MAG TPA: hypothetical protein [Caudoviricetes sp.]